MSLVKLQDTRSIYKNQPFLCTNNEQLGFAILKRVPSTIAPPKWNRYKFNKICVGTICWKLQNTDGQSNQGRPK